MEVLLPVSTPAYIELPGSFEVLSEETAIAIFQYLSIPELCTLSLVCKKFYVMHTDGQLKKHMVPKAIEQLDVVRSLFLSESIHQLNSIIRNSYRMNLYLDNEGTIQRYVGEDTGFYEKQEGGSDLKWVAIPPKNIGCYLIPLSWNNGEVRQQPVNSIYSLQKPIPHLDDFANCLTLAATKIYRVTVLQELNDRSSPSLRWQLRIQDRKNFPTIDLLKVKISESDNRRIDNYCREICTKELRLRDWDFSN